MAHRNRAVAFIDKYRLHILSTIVVLGGVLRLYNLAHGTPALSQDELVNGYDAYSLAHTMRDHHGAFLPLIFASFGDSVSVALTYLTVPFVLIGGLTEFAVRLPIALTGIASIVLIYLLVKEVSKREGLALLAGFLLAVSPWNITLTRWAVPPCIVPFCLLLFLWLLALAYNRSRSKNYLLVGAGLAAGLLTYSYPSAEILAPLLLGSTGVIFFWKQWRHMSVLFISYALSVLPLLYLVVFKPSSNFARFSSVKIDATGADFVKEVLLRYKDYFSYKFYFGGHSQNPIMHVPGSGNFYPILSVFIIACLLIIGFRAARQGGVKWAKHELSPTKLRIAAFLAVWAIIGPLPAAISIDFGHVTRAIFMLPLVTLLIAGCVYFVLTAIKPARWRYAALGLVLLGCLTQTATYIHRYNTDYPEEAAASYQYGVKQGIQYIAARQQHYQTIIIDRNINQPYIYYLFYTKYPPKQLNYDEINATANQHLSFAVTKIGKYYFNPLTSADIKGTDKVHSIKAYDNTWYDVYTKGSKEIILKVH